MSTGSDAWTRIGRAHSLTVFGLALATICVYSSSVTLVLIDRVRREMDFMARRYGECRATARAIRNPRVISRFTGGDSAFPSGIRRASSLH
jgi:hypothetical protein